MSVPAVRHAVLPVALGALLAVAACSDDAPEVQESVVAETDHLVVGDGEGVTPDTPTPDAADTPRPGWLVGPSFSLGVVGHTVADSVPADQAAAFGFEEGPVEAPEGHEFLLAVTDPDSEVDEELDAVLNVDGSEARLESLPHAGQTLAAVVPQEATAVLAVTDHERTQSLDLRSGERPSEIVGFYNAAATSDEPRNYSGSGEATGDPGDGYKSESRAFSIDMTLDSASRSPWHADRGWADEGQVWITVPVSNMRTDSVWGFDDGDDSNEPIITWEMDEQDVFSLEAGGDDAVASKGDTTFVADDDENPVDGAKSPFDPASVDLLFEVSETADQAILEVAPGGDLNAVWVNADGPAEWDEEPEADRIGLEF